MENRPTQDHFSKVSIYNFSGLKNIKKWYIEMTKKIYLETFEKCPGSVCFPLLQTLLPFYWRKCKLRGSARTKLYPSVSNRPSGIEESRHVSDKHMKSCLYIEIYIFNCVRFKKLWADKLLRFQWQIERESRKTLNRKHSYIILYSPLM